ncbi:MAG: pirin family protein [Anaerolineales bacterium]|nr:pirin family protein [Anaerolineales bacterium]
MDGQIRKVEQIVEPQYVVEGAGVRLKRSIATRTLDYVDPFLLFDHFGSDNPNDYIAGFPMHPHRGIETVTYMLAGAVRHGDSMGNSGVIEAGDVQWMTAGRGIMHEEMPEVRQESLNGFQLWINLPAKLKMTQPSYQEVLSEQIPEIEREDGVRIRIIAGQADGISGPVTEIAADPIYLDVTVPANTSFSYPIERGHAAIVYQFEGEGIYPVMDDSEKRIGSPKMLALDDGENFHVHTGVDAIRFLLIAGKPLYEPIARYGPFVMNTQQEIQQALRDLRNGTFV